MFELKFNRVIMHFLRLYNTADNAISWWDVGPVKYDKDNGMVSMTSATLQWNHLARRAQQTTEHT